ncbi:hypothetical protein AB1K62_14300 [Parasphingorhabdus sp. JC815]|uniref:hypothetical protein n=1 Tax=Parasphingorhabdus sp. JC815 TaxID=3232140 RepID=UPI00345A917D
MPESQSRLYGSLPAWGALVISLAALAFSAGTLRSELATAQSRLAKLEQRADIQSRAGNQVNDRLARIETKLDLVLEERR